MKRWVLAALFLLGLGASSAKAEVWTYDGGAFRRQDAHHWIERNSDGVYSYVEVSHNAEGGYYELRDAERSLSVRLFGDHADIKLPSGGGWRRWLEGHPQIVGPGEHD